MTDLNDVLKPLVEAAREAVKAISQGIIEAAKQLSDSVNWSEFNKLWEDLIRRHPDISECPNRRVVHLAYNAKKGRVRKKNYNRALKIIEREQK